MPSWSLITANELQEQWLWYERLEREDDYDVRNRQIYQRVKEVQKVLSLMETLNEGKNVRNFMDVKCQFDLLQFKVGIAIKADYFSHGGFYNVTWKGSSTRRWIGVLFAESSWPWSSLNRGSLFWWRHHCCRISIRTSIQVRYCFFYAHHMQYCNVSHNFGTCFVKSAFSFCNCY